MSKEHTNSMEYSLALEKEEIPPYAATWMNLKNNMLSKISQSHKTDSVCFHFHEFFKVARFIKLFVTALTTRQQLEIIIFAFIYLTFYLLSGKDSVSLVYCSNPGPQSVLNVPHKD